jgi:hypothetical protein
MNQPREENVLKLEGENYMAFSVKLLMKVATELLQDRLGNKWTNE